MNKAIGSLMILLALLVGLYGVLFPILLPKLEGPVHDGIKAQLPLFVWMHVVAGGYALFVGALQPWLSQGRLKSHRAIGYSYSLAMVISAIGALYMAQFAFGGFISTLGLSIAAVSWVGCTLAGIYYARLGDLNRHRRWMLRSLALVYAAVTLRIELPLLNLIFSEGQSQQIVYWFSWSLNWVLVELYLKIRPSHTLAPPA